MMIAKKIAPVVSAILISAIALILTLKINIPNRYNDFIVGSTTWSATDKISDLIVFPISVFIFVIFYSFFKKIIVKLDKNSQYDSSFNFSIQLLLWSIPFYIIIGNLYLNSYIDYKLLYLSAFGVIFISAISYFKKDNTNALNPLIWGLGFLSVILISLIPYEIACIFNKTSLNMGHNIGVRTLTTSGYALFFTSYFLMLLFFIKNSTLINKYITNILFVSQIGLPLFFFCLYPSKLLLPSGDSTKYHTTIWLKLFLISIIFIGIYDVISRFKKYQTQDKWKKLLSPIAFFSLVVVLKSGSTAAPFIPEDDYHFGEKLLGWWSYLNGAIPYVDYIPAHGILVDDFTMFLNWFFYDGNTGSYIEADRIGYTIIAFVAYMMLYYYSSSILFAFLCTILLGNNILWMSLVPFICLMLSPKTLKDPAKWLATFTFAAPLLILCIPPQGLILLLSFCPIILIMVYRQLFLYRNKWKYIIYSALFFIVLLSITPLFSMLLGAIRYVLENGAINQVAYGTIWAVDWKHNFNSGFSFEVVRMSWVVLMVICFYIVCKYWRNYKNPKSCFYIAFTFLLLSLLTIPYSMGRIDGGDISRTGKFSWFAWAILLPLLSLRFYKKDSRIVALFCGAFICSLLGGSMMISSGYIISASLKKIFTNQLKYGSKLGLDNIGNAYVNDEYLNRLLRLKTVLDKHLLPKESYLDLTSRNAQYFYLDRFLSIPITAPYNMPSLKQQKTVVEHLKVLPKIALLWGDNITHDGGGLALRNPYLYRFAINNYIPKYENGFIIGYRKSDVKGLDDNFLSVEIKKITDENWENGISRHDPGFVINDKNLAPLVKAGDKVRLKDGEIREIQRISNDGTAIWLTGGAFSSSNILNGNSVDIFVNEQSMKEYRILLFEKAFSHYNFGKIPVAWGKSEKSLDKKMDFFENVENITPKLNHLSNLNGAYTVNGNDPFLTFDLSSKNISGDKAGLLKINFSCLGQRATPQIQVFWWGDEQNGPFEESSIKFEAENGTLIIPLDASPRWLTLNKIKGLRIDLDNELSCNAILLNGISFYQRKF